MDDKKTNVFESGLGLNIPIEALKYFIDDDLLTIEIGIDNIKSKEDLILESVESYDEE